jgi:hypothetical protein
MSPIFSQISWYGNSLPLKATHQQNAYYKTQASLFITVHVYTLRSYFFR